MHRHGPVQHNDAVITGEHGLDLLGGPALVLSKQKRGETVGLMQANAAMTQGALSLSKQLRLHRVVHVDGMLVRKIELQCAEDVVRPRRLGEGILPDVCVSPVDAISVHGMPRVAHLEAMFRKDCRAWPAKEAALLQGRLQIFPDDGLGHCPFRVEHYGAHLGGEDRCWIFGLSDNYLLHIDGLVVLDDAGDELRNVVPDVVRAKLGGHPAPALHIDDEKLGVALIGRLLAAGLALGTRFEERLPQQLKLFLFGMERPQIAIRRRRSYNLDQNGLGIENVRLLSEQLANPRWRQASTAG